MSRPSFVGGMTAAEETFALPELLETILLHVDQQTLLISAQRVCTAWRDQIQKTPSLMRHLFLHSPSGEAGHSSNIHTPADSRRFNPLLVKAFPSFFEYLVDDENPAPQLGTIDMSDVILGTGIFKARPTVHLAARKPATDSFDTFNADEWDEVYKREKAIQSQNPFLRHGASWLRMQLCDPPITAPGVHGTISSQGGNDFRYEDVEKKDGLRMGELYRYMLRFTMQYPRPRFVVLWPKQGRYPFKVRLPVINPERSRDFQGRSVVVEPPVLIQHVASFTCIIEFDDREYLYLSTGYSFFGLEDDRELNYDQRPEL